jgi:hypothetical protein
MALTRPGARRLGTGHALNHPTVCTIGTVAPGAGFSHYLLRVCQVHSRGVQFVDAETTSLKRPNFFIFRLIEVPKEPRQGFWDSSEAIGAVGLSV